ncbi:MAG: hypothetical protein RLZZ383_2204 [Pseudomonadota bacterium]
MIRLTDEATVTMYAHAREGYPHEVVGILAGEGASRRVTRVAALVNERADSAHNRYAVGPLALQRAERALEAEGLSILGYYHSHPDHPAMYSEFDRDHAWPNLTYVIVSVVAGEVVDTRAWRLTEDRAAMEHEAIGDTTTDGRCRGEAAADR